MILPLAKLGALLIKTLSKPIASRLKVQAARHPRFRSLIINVAQTNHKFSTNLQRRIYGHSTDVAVHPLNEEKAVQAATDLLGELFIFSVGGVAVIFEVQRSVRSEARKEEARRQELEALRQRDDDLARELVLLKQRFDEIEQYARARGIAGIFTLRNSVGTEEKKQTQSAPT
ncbi:OPA3-like protein isoform X1 [Cryptomeria japonica]|uniref:OPA3-like protein isoform X1 n=1 Tax=Cryptomeria japonica TaxID=3369 RepID=UPI0025AD8FF4|nr:OPA3-like protein isoform X1 [Cryptomeria japonica]